jgi:polar amino acid transport system permease protein
MGEEFTFGRIVLNLLMATQWTIILSLIAFICGGIVGFLVMLMRISSIKPLRFLSWMYVEFFEGTPLLLQLFLAFFGVSVVFGINLSPLMAATVALTVFTSSFLADIWRGSVEALPKGQWEAASVLGLNYIQQLRFVILPQAVKLAIAPTVGFLVQVIKGTSLASVIGFTEVTRAASQINNVTLQSLLVFAIAGAVYFLLCYPLSFWSQRIEQQLNLKA